MSFHRRQLKRVDHVGHARYLTCSCYQRMPLLGNVGVRDAFVEQIGRIGRQEGFELYAWVIMPEHFHLLILPRDGRVSLLLCRLKASFAQQMIRRWREVDAKILSRMQGRDGAVRFWQHGGGYDRNIDSDRELTEKIDYIHANPVRRGLVKLATDWKWSSARTYAGLESDGPKITCPFL